jgi:predicted transcriptional regulator
MTSDRMSITLPHDLANRIRSKAKAAKRPVSRIIAEELRKAEEEEIRQRMIEGYKAMAEENRKLAEEFLPLAAEVWPDD